MNTANILSVNYGAYNAIRMLIGVYHAAFLISTGVTISQLAVLQIVFSVTVLILDFPLSVIACLLYTSPSPRDCRQILQETGCS